jgi:MSHA biogenesis protein MshP
MTLRPRQSGFAYVAAVVLLVILAAMATAMVRLNTTQRSTLTQDLLGMRASQAARGGVEWGLYMARKQLCNATHTTAAPMSATLDQFKSDSGFTVTVKCSVSAFNEGEESEGVPLVKHFYRIEAVACNGSGASCPDAGSVATVDYVERMRVASACLTSTGADCY